ncbi:MAG TPA: c-type cytochrome [Acidimicrobiia bacterium]|jgi:ubiquinol-cytochrome c reductase cytochrome c subunit|nr:c-type cytochrome [Acidimicrobiia bacterium]
MSRRLVLASLAGVLAAGSLAIGLHTAGATERPGRRDAGGGNIERGRRLFLVGCASCHGQSGEGTAQGPDLRGVGAASADFQLSTGRMPNTAPDRQSVTKRSPYTRREIDDLVAYVASLGPGPPIPDVNDPPGDLQEGGELYLDNCAACHSASGNGGALSVGRDAPTVHGATQVEVGEAIRTGPGNMPVFGPGTFTRQQVNSIVRYVEYLKKPEDPGGLSLGLVGPITEGLVAILVGLGALMLLTRWIEPPAVREEPPAVTAASPTVTAEPEPATAPEDQR